MSTPLQSTFPLARLKLIADLRAEKVEKLPAGARYVGMENVARWTGRLSTAASAPTAEGGANRFYEGDVLFAKLRPYLAKGWVADGQGFCSPEFLVLSTKLADPRFLRYCMLSPPVVAAVDASTYGAKMPRANWDFIGSLCLPSPSLNQQQAVADLLDRETAAIDALIAKKEELLRLIERYRAAVVNDSLREAELAAGTRKLKLKWLFDERGRRAETGEEPLAATQSQGVVPKISLPYRTMESREPDTAGQRLVLPGDFVISLRSFEGGLEHSAYRGAVSPAYTVLVPRGPVSESYFRLYFKSSTFVASLSQHKKGIRDGQSVPWTRLREDSVLVPTVEVQEACANRVAAKLGELMALTRATEKACELLVKYRGAVISGAVSGSPEAQALHSAPLN